MVTAAFQMRDGLYADEDEEDAPDEEDLNLFLSRFLSFADRIGLGRLPNVFNLRQLAIPPVLITTYTVCIRCPTRPVLRRYKRFRTVNLITSSYTKQTAMLAIAVCPTCRAKYFPDRVVVRQDDTLRQFYVNETPFLRISKPAELWVERTVAIQQAQTILRHETFAGFATQFNMSVISLAT